jgi:DNA-binding transcriptional LysR family regulator
VRLTDEGRRVVLAARDVENSVSDMWRVAAMAEREANGPIRLAITEGLGSFWLTPRIVDYMNETGAQNRIELQCAMRSVDVLRMEADISVQLERPTARTQGQAAGLSASASVCQFELPREIRTSKKRGRHGQPPCGRAADRPVARI